MKKIVYLGLINCQLMIQASEGLKFQTQENYQVVYIVNTEDELQSLQKALVDEKFCDAYCEKWSHVDYPYNVDRMINPTTKITWGTLISEAMSSNRKLALSIAQLVQKKRTDKAAVLKFFFVELLVRSTTWYEKALFEDFKAWFNKHPMNVNLVILDTGRTIGQELCDRELQGYTTLEQQFAKTVQPSWSQHISAVQQAFINLRRALIDEEYCELYCEMWSHREYPHNVDELLDLESNRAWSSFILDAWYTHCELAFKIAGLVQRNRTDKAAIVRFLFNLWSEENDTLVFGALKMWCRKHPIDVDKAFFIGDIRIGEIINCFIENDRFRGLATALLFQADRTDKKAVLHTLSNLQDWESLATWIHRTTPSH